MLTKLTIETFFENFVNKILNIKWVILTILAISLILTLPGIAFLDISIDVNDFFPKDDPVLKRQAESSKLFKNSDFIGILFESENIFSIKSLESIKKLGDELNEKITLGSSVLSIVHIKNCNLKFKNGKLISSQDEIDKFIKKIKTSKLFKGSLFSSDYKEAWIQLNLSPYPKDSEWNEKLSPPFTAGKEAYDIIDKNRSEKITPTGFPLFSYRKDVEMRTDLIKILLLGLIVAIILTIIIVRDLKGIIGALLIIFSFSTIIFGIQGWLKIPINSAFISVPILLGIGVSIGFSIHLIRFFKTEFRKTGCRRDSVLYAVRNSSKPLLFSAFTTMIALISFIFISITPLRWVGLTSSLSIFLILILTITILPILLSIGKDNKTFSNRNKKDFFELFALKIANNLDRLRLPIIAIFILITLLSLWGLTKLEIDLNNEKMMGDNLKHMKDLIHISNSKIGTSEAMELVLKLPPQSLTKPEYLKKIEQLELEIRNLSLINNSISFNTFIRIYNYMIHNSRDKYNSIPANRLVLNQVINIFENVDKNSFNQWSTNDNSTTRIIIQIKEFSSNILEEDIIQIENSIRSIFGEDVEFFFNGPTYQMVVMNQYVTKGLILSIFMTLISISFIMIVVLKSIKLGLIAMIPNIFPIIVVGGIMGFMKIPLEFITMTIAPIILGLAVDDTIHLFSHIKDEMNKSNDFSKIIEKTFLQVGSSITETTIILSITFLVFTFSDVNSVKNIGFLTTIGFISAYAADIFITPLILKKIKF